MNSVLRMHARDKWSWIYIPWLILMSSFVINLIISSLVQVEGGITTGGLASIFCYMLVAGIMTINNTFPFALGMNVRRTDYLIGTAAMALLVSAGTALAIFLLAYVEGRLIPGWGVSLHFFSLPFLESLSPFTRLAIFFVLVLYMFFQGFAIASVHRRFGRSGMMVLFGGLLAAGTLFSYLASANGWWVSIGGWLVDHHRELFWWTLPVTMLYMLVSYGLLRRSTV
ncbi:hypothetical protein MJA45_26385 [Paenibacillus aurantius]|uniref:Uncharacterized protein n=1 Tax=Paenibacillus aurantius TaxID=2918900 RepID=A0AA96LD17_9BACL|nr:hypothetical protein [Paenibacillus aurantius]WNQ11085.1 hypothetical protein MJA45_26385 [Paenibacillus aurantius]